MYCFNCGAKVQDGAAFCGECGQKLDAVDERDKREQESVINITPTKKVNPDGKKDFCPYCGAPAENCTPINKSEIKGGSSGFLSGCLGMLLLGPAGLLCGFCGRSSGEIVNKTWWVCGKCGREFMTVQDALSNALSESRMAAIYSLFLAAGASNSWYGGDDVSTGFLFVAIMIAIWGAILLNAQKASGIKLDVLLTRYEAKMFCIAFIGYFLVSVFLGARWGMVSAY